MSPFFRRIEKNLYLKQPPQIRPSEKQKTQDHAINQQFVLEEKHNSPHSPIYIVGEWGYNHTVELTEYAAVVFHETRW
jgi:hypothetical protein